MSRYLAQVGACVVCVGAGIFGWMSVFMAWWATGVFWESLALYVCACSCECRDNPDDSSIGF